MEENKLIALVEGAAKMRGDKAIPREFIEAALKEIDEGRKVDRYPTGMPSAKGVYDIASSLYSITLN